MYDTEQILTVWEDSISTYRDSGYTDATIAIEIVLALTEYFNPDEAPVENRMMLGNRGKHVHRIRELFKSFDQEEIEHILEKINPVLDKIEQQEGFLA